MIIGRHHDCDLILDNPLVSRRHARLEGGILVDLNSANGVFVEGRRVERAELKEGQEVYVGPARLRYFGGELVPAGRQGAIDIQVRHLTFHPSTAQRPLLEDLDLTFESGKFVAVVGTSGAGKSTLMRCLSGRYRPSQGEVNYNGRSVWENQEMFRPLMGFVPQDDIVHRPLPVEAALYYAARLRLPPDTQPLEIQRRVDFVLANMRLSERRHLPIANLSGGERKRVSIAVELLTEPSLFFLDEPTSGLDPGLEKQMMQLLARIARQGKTVVLITHATQNIVLCDQVVFLAPGGRLVYSGPPARALDFFGVRDFAEIYLKVLEPEDAVEWQKSFQEQHGGKQPALTSQIDQQPAAPTRRRWGLEQVGRWWRQLEVLTSRYAQLIWCDRGNLALLALQAPLVGSVLANLFPPDTFALAQEVTTGGKFPLHEGPTLLFMMVVSALFFGAVNSCREVVKELPILRRERHVNLMLTPYLGSKVLVLALVGALQCSVLQGIIFWSVPMGLGATATLTFLLFLWLVYLGGVGLGLLLSSICSSAEQATTLVSVVLIIQLVLSGAFVKPEQMTPFLGLLSISSISRWGFAGLGQLMSLNQRFNELGLGWITGDYYMPVDLLMPLLTALVGLHLAVVYLALRWREH